MRRSSLSILIPDNPQPRNESIIDDLAVVDVDVDVLLESTVDPSPETTEVDAVDDVASILIYPGCYRVQSKWVNSPVKDKR